MIGSEPNTEDVADRPALSAEWIGEIERRSAEIDAGEVELTTAEEVFAELRPSLGKPK